MTVTIEDISKKLGISISTISKALNGYSDVSTRTRDLVLQTAQEMGYHPNTAARNLRRGRTDKIGIIISESIVYISEYLAEIIPGAALTAERNDTNLILYTSVENQIANLTRICRSREVDGMILLWSSEMSDMIDLLEMEKMPYILIGRRSEREHISYIAPDNFAGAKALTQHLLELGHRRIGFMLRSLLGNTHTDRFAGYCSALEEANQPIIDELLIETIQEPHAGYHAMNKLLDLENPPTALFSMHDVLAVDAMAAATERGLRVPDDISITGFDGLRSSLITTPRLTTVRQPLQKIGEQTVSALLTRIDNPEHPPIRDILPVELLIRESTASPERSQLR